MFYPDIKTFKTLAKKGNLIPVYKEILADMETPVSAFLKLKDSRYAFLLESVEGGERIARFSFIGADPRIIFRSAGDQVEIIDGGKKSRFAAAKDPLEELKKIMQRYRAVEDGTLPRFFGGAVGYVGYDMVRYFEDVEVRKEDKVGLPDSCFMISDTILIFDHVNHTIRITANAFVPRPQDADRAYRDALRKIGLLEKRLSKPVTIPIVERAQDGAALRVRSNMSQPAFEGMVRKAKEYIRAGDIIQTVLSQRLEADIMSSSFDIYRALRSVNPSPYMYFLRFDGFDVVGASPEILVRCEKDVVTVRPIAGTAKRGATPEEDAALEKKLLADPKERAEHIMLVDLGRNDIGRVCEKGSVAVTDLMVIERYSHVMHIVSQVEGNRRPGLSSLEVLQAAFPAGTVSGAPKIRAMEIIEELEGNPRGPYAGAVGYIGFDGSLDTCITIRTLVQEGENVHVQAGAGIVYDSVPEREYEETQNKARALFKALQTAMERGNAE